MIFMTASLELLRRGGYTLSDPNLLDAIQDPGLDLYLVGQWLGSFGTTSLVTQRVSAPHLMALFVEHRPGLPEAFLTLCIEAIEGPELRAQGNPQTSKVEQGRADLRIALVRPTQELPASLERRLARVVNRQLTARGRARLYEQAGDLRPVLLHRAIRERSADVRRAIAVGCSDEEALRSVLYPATKMSALGWVRAAFVSLGQWPGNDALTALAADIAAQTTTDQPFIVGKFLFRCSDRDFVSAIAAAEQHPQQSAALLIAMLDDPRADRSLVERLCSWPDQRVRAKAVQHPRVTEAGRVAAAKLDSDEVTVTLPRVALERLAVVAIEEQDRKLLEEVLGQLPAQPSAFSAIDDLLH